LYFSRLFIFSPCTNNKPQAINGLPGQQLGMGVQVLQAAVEHIELGQEQQAEGDEKRSPEAKGHAHEDLAEQLGGIHRRICDGGQGVEGIPALQGQHPDAQHNRIRKLEQVTGQRKGELFAMWVVAGYFCL